MLTFATGELVLTEVTTLDHEVLDNTVELGPLVAEALGESSTVLLNTGRKSTEVLHGLRHGLIETLVSPRTTSTRTP